MLRTPPRSVSRAHGPASATRRVHRRHLSPATRAALGTTSELQIDLGDLLWLGLATAPSEHDEAPVRVHPISAVMPRVGNGIEALAAIAPPDRDVVHPSLRSFGDSAAGYLRARRWWRRWYLTRQLAYGILIAGVVAATPVIASATNSANARVANGTRNVDRTAAAAATAVHRATKSHTAPAVVTPLTVAPKTSTFRGLWVNGISGRWFVPYPAPPNTAFLVCTRHFESDTAGGYTAIDPAYEHFGAYQFLRSTWNNVARVTGFTSLVGVNPAYAAHKYQDFLALYLYRWQGASHWQGRCAGT
ncbi:MAG TPA: hypothetical protein VGO03_05635 [Acidimicrobiia bacterium]